MEQVLGSVLLLCVEGCFECIGKDMAGKELFLGLVYTRTLEGCLGSFVCLFVCFEVKNVENLRM